LILSILVPGFGQYYNGEVKKPLFFFIIGFAILLIGVSYQVMGSIVGLVVCIAPSLIIRGFAGWEAFRSGKKQTNVDSKYKKTWLYLIMVASFGLLTILIHPFLSIRIGVYDGPTSGNMPTIQPHDYVIADFNYYNRNEIDYGYIVVFEKEN